MARKPSTSGRNECSNRRPSWDTDRIGACSRSACTTSRAPAFKRPGLRTEAGGAIEAYIRRAMSPSMVHLLIRDAQPGNSPELGSDEDSGPLLLDRFSVAFLVPPPAGNKIP